MYTKNLLQNGYKTVEGALATIVPFNKAPKKEINVEAQVNATNFLPMTDFNLPSKISTPKGIMALTGNNKGIEAYSKISRDINYIDYTKKRPNSLEGIDLNFGISLDEAIQFYIYLYESGYAEEGTSGTNQANAMLNAMAPDLTAYKQSGNISPRLVEMGNQFKLELYAVFTEAQWKISRLFDDGSETEIYKRIEEYKEPLEDLSKLYYYDGDMAAQYMSKKASQAQQNLYNYVETMSPYKTSRTSANAKDRILNNPWYLSYVESVKETSPELFDQLEMSASVPYITDLESKLLWEISAHNDELQKQKDLIEEEYGWEYMNEMFSAPRGNGGSFDDLLSLKWESYKTVVDDDIENSVKKTAPITLDFDSYFDSNIDYSAPTSPKVDSSSASAIIEEMTEEDIKALSDPNRKPIQSAGANTRFDALTGKMVSIDYERDKALPKLEGAEHAISTKERERMNEQMYSKIRSANIKKIIGQ